MSRVAHTLTNKLIVLPLAVLVITTGGAGLRWHQHRIDQLQAVRNAQQQLSQLSYSGKQGVNALVLLEQHARVRTKHYSFGDMVTAIDGIVGTGPKYWTLYVNHKMSNVGAGAYITKSSDQITWKLQ